MRTKILLTAAAAMAAGVLASNAQVYSANIVGYVNTDPAPNTYAFWANPLTTGNDVLSNVVVNPPGGTQVSVWGVSGFTTYTYSALTHHWKNGATIDDTVPLPPGAGFFIYSSVAYTNTWVGSVISQANSFQTVTNVVPSGYQAVGEIIPYSDVVTNPATVNLQVPGGTTLLIWDENLQSYDPLYTYSGLSHTWKQGVTVTNPVVQPGEGFFINAAATLNWVQTLTNN